MKVAWSEKKVNERIDEGQGQLVEGFIAKSRQKAEERGREKSSPTSAAAAAAAAARGFTAANTVERCSVVLRRQRPNANNFFSEILNVMHVRQLCVCIYRAPLRVKTDLYCTSEFVIHTYCNHGTTTTVQSHGNIHTTVHFHSSDVGCTRL
jgi:hypothetical protein